MKMLATDSAPRFAVPEAAAPVATPGLGSMLEVLLALAVVVAVIFAFAWLARRLRGAGAQGAGVEVIAEVALGAKERAVLLQVRGRQFLIGVASGSVRTLHAFEPGELPAPAQTGSAGGAPSFQTLLRRGLGLK